MYTGFDAPQRATQAAMIWQTREGSYRRAQHSRVKSSVWFRYFQISEASEILYQ